MPFGRKLLFPSSGGMLVSRSLWKDRLLDRLDALPPGQLWVHCASGYRASIAASLLDRAGRDVVLVDDSYDSAVAAGLTTTP